MTSDLMIHNRPQARKDRELANAAAKVYGTILAYEPYPDAISVEVLIAKLVAILEPALEPEVVGAIRGTLA